MDLYDVIDEISAKQVRTTESGDTKVEGLIVGKVTKNYDMQFPGRVCVSIPTRDAPSNTLLWARVISFYMGNSWGEYFLPEVGDEVVLGFEGGNIERPYVIGSIPTMKSMLVKRSANKDNTIKQIMTRAGNTIEITDTAAPAGGGAPTPQDKIRIYTANKEREVCLDNATGRITLKDQKNENYVQIDTTKQAITIRAAQQMRIIVGQNITITASDMNGAGSVTIACKKFTVNAQGKITLNSTSGVAIKQGSISIDGQNISINSQGTLTANGQVVKLG